ncbi:asparagine synthase (glutamine-hydrolyzing) [Pseudobacteriovorax antillogorgiicola]|uniref:asparagine synthase (glutamine-hydrolyzing) n=1 Tax=Pseudobacteriovorax antillogorgiicola TaxID=1513793 RepID=A0A1Y6BH95_9BACT|nr:asparagine synthase (glutamine-hydrolyzing) [Pseudobacteriovorax antillogorgiicola]TCS56181.1 asparagine synthase (glutamine-hydrolysing) [Pseudobacteriovorax antillogorgiicola]SMF08955.1 asparagine synthase (glutamine-hydrolysing) [Pseudobacteriovorax antillogorgiicola]
MCGINIIVKKKNNLVDPQDLAAMSSAIEHRGPDEAGFSLLNDNSIGLAHVRLSILDIHSGQQPMFDNKSGELAIVFNGEIYDHEIWRKKLEAKGSSFATKSDTEVIIELYRHYGTDAFAKLNGEFAFMLWDGRKKNLYAVRDYAGVKPLFFYESDQEMIFSSEVKGIFALPRVPRKISKDYLCGPLFGAFSPAISAFEGIQSIKPGHFLCINAEGKKSEHRYWQQSYDVDQSMTFEDAKKLVREKLQKAVSRRLVADVKVNTYLSGGLDSSIVCALMSRERQDFNAYTIGFGDSVYDESHLARQMADHYGAKFNKLDCSMDTIADNLERTAYHTESAIANPGAVAKMQLSELVHQQGEKVCLTGEGADEVFAGYPYFKLEAIWRMLKQGGEERKQGLELWKKFQAKETRSEGIHWNRKVDWSRPNHIYGYAAFMPLRSEEYGNLIQKLFQTKKLGIMANDNPENCFKSQFDIEAMKALDPINASKEMTLNQLYCYMIPNLADRVEMANSIECRTPFLDRELLEAVGTIPPKYFMDLANLREKYVLFDSYKDELPQFHRKIHKHPFMSPDWLTLSKTHRGRELFGEYLSQSALQQSEIFKPKFVALLKFLWNTLPRTSGLRKKIDTLMGLTLSMQVIHKKLIENTVPHSRDFKMIHRKPKVIIEGEMANGR